MDKNEFFRQATLRICGNLEIEQALASSLNLLRQEMPVDRILLQLFEEGMNAVRTVATATLAGGKIDNRLTPMSYKAKEEILNFEQEYMLKSPDSAWFIPDESKLKLMFEEMLRGHEVKISSLLVLPLRMGGDKVVGGGGIFLTTEGEAKFTRQHADLLYMLREPFAIAMSNALKHSEVTNLRDMLADNNRYLHNELRRLSGDEIIGANFGLKEVMHKVQQVAALDSPVLLLGETGVGKDIIASTVHYSSLRSDNPFVSVNCGAIPDTLIDSELFGHEKGAFTGALAQKRGRFERANKGTIFLDEIGELPPQAQVRLLRVLQTKEIERVGGVKTIPLDIRIIAATNRDLEGMVNSNEFREDLWFRLNVFPIQIPPLRDRQSDIPALLQHFILLKSKDLKLPVLPMLAPNAIDPLMEYHWPGNVRELENVVERALILNPEGPVTFEHMWMDQQENISLEEYKSEETYNLDENVTQLIHRVLKITNYRIHGSGGAADLLGINPSTLRNRMKKLGIEYRKRNRTGKT